MARLAGTPAGIAGLIKFDSGSIARIARLTEQNVKSYAALVNADENVGYDLEEIINDLYRVMNDMQAAAERIKKLAP